MGDGVDPDDRRSVGAHRAPEGGTAQGVDDPVVSGGVRLCDVSLHHGFAAGSHGQARLKFRRCVDERGVAVLGGATGGV